MVRKVKITGKRSIESKLRRLAYELEHDTSKIKADYGDEREFLANSLRDISSQLGAIARGLS